jgi:hypothetical protein
MRSSRSGLHRREGHAWQSATLHQASRPWRSGQASHRPPGGPVATTWVSCSYPQVSSPSARAPPGDGPVTVFLPPCVGGFCTPWTGDALIASTDVVSAVTVDSGHEVRPLTSSPLSRRQSFGGSPVGAYFRSLLSRRTQRLLPSTCTVLYSLLCIRNKPGLSQPCPYCRSTAS